MYINEVITRLKTCANPLYPTFGEVMNMRQKRRTFKGKRSVGWASRYARWIDEHDFLRSLG